MLQILFALLAPLNVSASVCVVSTGWSAVYCDGKKVAKLEDYIKKPPTPEGSEPYALITAAISALQDNGYTLKTVTAQPDGKEYTLTK